MATTKTTLDSDVTKPSTTAPGDGPADTTDPTEIAVSVPVRPGATATSVGTVNAVQAVPAPARPPRDESHDRFETYDTTDPAGQTVSMRRNLETGRTEKQEN